MMLDEWLVRVLPAPGSVPAFDLIMILASTLGLVVPVLAIPWRLWRDERGLARSTLVALAAGLGLTLALQLLSMRPRPPAALPLLPIPPLPSFPSGHVVLVSIVLVALGARRSRALPWWLALGSAMALSRVHVGHHHATDVLGGVVLGVGLGLGAVAHARASSRDPWRHRWLLWPQLGLVLTISLVAYTGTFADGRVWWLRLPGMDKTLHFFLFGLLALGVHLHTRGRRLVLGRARLPFAVLIPLVGASAEELMQAASPHRTADLGDLLADLLGLLAFWWWAEAITSTPRRPDGRRDAEP